MSDALADRLAIGVCAFAFLYLAGHVVYAVIRGTL